MKEILKKTHKSVSLLDKAYLLNKMDLDGNRNPKTYKPNFFKVSKENDISRIQLIKW